MFQTPILFLIFNRPSATKEVFEQIKQIQPSNLYVAADGPRKDKDGESLLCQEVKDIVLSGIDWECEIKTLFRDTNLGCGKAVADGITWFYENVEEGIILEDDVVPNRSFFLFCRTMLSKFKDNQDIMHISGNNFQMGQIGDGCFYLSKIPHSWGWATWRRAWIKFDFNLKNFNATEIQNYFNDPLIDQYWHRVFNSTKIAWHKHVWDYQWIFCVFSNNGYCVLPQHNLVSNIGFGLDSTHTTDGDNYLANLKSYEMDIKVGQTLPIYNPTPDINFHKLFLLNILKSGERDVSIKKAVLILLSKLSFKVRKIINFDN